MSAGTPPPENPDGTSREGSHAPPPEGAPDASAPPPGETPPETPQDPGQPYGQPSAEPPYGQQPPPYGQASYSQRAAGHPQHGQPPYGQGGSNQGGFNQGGYDAVGAIKYGWEKFSNKPAELLVPMLVAVVVVGLLLAVGIAIGYVLCFIPAIIFGFLRQYTMFFVVDQRMKAVDAIKASIAFTRAHLAATLVFYLLASVTIFVGALLCGLGLLVAGPVVIVGSAYTYRVLNGHQVSPAV